MRLLLTSCGLPARCPRVREAFFTLIKKPIHDVRVAFVPTAAEVEQDRTFSQIDRKELEEAGVRGENIHDLLLDHPITLEDLQRHDVICVDGGNTFYLLQKVRESGFDAAIAAYLREGAGVYIGVSAGTCLAGPDIGFLEPWDDRTKATLSDTKALALVPVAYSPHYVDAEAALLQSCCEKVSYPIEPLRDGEAVMVDGSQIKIVR